MPEPVIATEVTPAASLVARIASLEAARLDPQAAIAWSALQGLELPGAATSPG